MNRSIERIAMSKSCQEVPKQLSHLDVAIIGAGLSGMYAVHCLREAGLSVRAFDEAAGIGGTWWWTRYPGARVDFPGGPYYCYTFSDELVREFDWPETHPAQASVLAYCEYVVDKFDLRRDIQLQTRIIAANYDAAAQRWNLETGSGERFSAQFVVCAGGSLSAVNKPAIPGLEDFAGECFHTARWPHRRVALEGKRVGVIGTGSSAVQAVPEIAREAGHLTVFQRTPQYVIPAGNSSIDAETKLFAHENWRQIRQQMMESILGSPFPKSTRSALEDTEEQRREVYEARWQMGGQGILFYTYGDLMSNREANKTLSDFVKEKIRKIVHKEETLEKLLPDYDIGGKRLVLGTDYYATFNRDNVTLVDLRAEPIVSVTPTGVRTQSTEYPLDVLILATGFDAMTGAMTRLNPRGRDGIALTDKWCNYFSTYLGMSMRGFPNLFMINGPQTPSVLWNMPFAAELQVDWIRDCIAYLREHQLGTIEPGPSAEATWGQEVDSIADQTLFAQNNSWFIGSNIPGKPRQFTVHLNGPDYFKRLSDIAATHFPDFAFEPEQAEASASS
jgi:cation diffusion facilitator CzcD-associated flavoprotein CzcO